MLDIHSQELAWSRPGLGRRDFLRVGAVSMLGLSLSDWFRMKANGMVKSGQAKAVIQLWMNGGPPHTDTFDPKPEAGEDYCGPLKKPVGTNVSGIRIGELLPLTAKHANRYSIIRSMTHSSNAHEVAAYIVLTGTMPSKELAYPTMGSVVALKKGNEGGYQGGLPPYITVTTPLPRISDAGFLGNDYRAFATEGDPNAKEFRVGGLVPPRGMTPERFGERRTLLQRTDALAKEIDKDKGFLLMDSYQQKSYGLILGEERKAFDLAEEKEDVRDRYGRNRFGQSCLLARRLVESGVPFVTINDGGWDTHKDNFAAMQRKLPVLDKGYSALIEDLAQRGLLDSTIVVWAGEFGRTSKIAHEAPWHGGRHHWGSVFSAVVAGGGFHGGSVVGSSDFRGETVRDRPVYPWDLSASIYKLLGIDPNGRLPHPQGCVAYVTPLATGAVQSGGLLNEIM